jgi:hypothetical protein
MVDFYIPKEIDRHRIARGGGTPPQLQFLVQWNEGWTNDVTLAKRIIKKHPVEKDLYFVEYKPSWEISTNHSIQNLIPVYKTKHGISTFGLQFDNDIEQTVQKDLDVSTIIPNYTFSYEERSDNTRLSEDGYGGGGDPPQRRRRGRPRKNGVKEKRKLIERSPECECSRACRQHFDQLQRKNTRDEFQSLKSLSEKYAFLSKLIELKNVAVGDSAVVIRHSNKKRKKYTAKYHFIKDGRKVRVCQYFFMTVLEIGNTTLNNSNDF